jgi:hypothetical protein
MLTPSSPCLENGEFDDIVVGSGFCALAYIDEALRLDPFRKILLLERGGKHPRFLNRSSVFILIHRCLRILASGSLPGHLPFRFSSKHHLNLILESPASLPIRFP